MKKNKTEWSCISNCGACCRLDPTERSEAIEVLNPRQREEYMKLVGTNGWCIHYDTGGKKCRIYKERPDFCRVSNLFDFFAVEAPQQAEFAIKCCTEQIRSTYGPRSRVMSRYSMKIRKSNTDGKERRKKQRRWQ